MQKTYNNWEQTRVKILKPDRNLPEEFELCGYDFAINYVLEGLIPAILMNIDNVAQRLEHFSLKHRVHIVER